MDTTVHARIVIVKSSRFQLIEQADSVRLMLEHFRIPMPALAQDDAVIQEVTMDMPSLLIAGQKGHRLFKSCFKVFQPGAEAAEFQRLRAAYQEFSERQRKVVR